MNIIPKAKDFSENGTLTINATFMADEKLLCCKKAFLRIVFKIYGVHIRDGEGGIEQNALFVHLVHHTEGGGVGHKVSEKCQGRHGVDAKLSAEGTERPVQHLCHQRHKGQCAGQGHAGVDTNKSGIFKGVEVG